MTIKANRRFEAESIHIPQGADPTGLLARCARYINEVSRKSARHQGRRGGSRHKSLEYVRWQVEDHFTHYQEEAAACDNILEEFAQATRTPEVTSRTGPADPTAENVVHVELAFEELFGWRDVIRNTFRKFQGTPVADVLHARFDLHLSAETAAVRLCMSSSAFYANLGNAMQYAALIAAQKNLLDLD